MIKIKFVFCWFFGKLIYCKCHLPMSGDICSSRGRRPLPFSRPRLHLPRLKRIGRTLLQGRSVGDLWWSSANLSGHKRGTLAHLQDTGRIRDSPGFSKYSHKQGKIKMYKISHWTTKNIPIFTQFSLTSQFGWVSPFQMGQAVLTSTLARAFCSGQMGLL